MKKVGLLLILVFLLTACVKKEADIDAGNGTPLPPTEQDTTHEVIEEEEEEAEKTEEAEEDAVSTDFFMADGAVAYFKGDGIEFSTYTTRTEWLTDQYVNVYEDNGGIEMVKSYRLDDQEIVVLQEAPLEEENTFPTVDDLESMTAIKTYLTFPLEVGDKIDAWTVVSVDAELNTPLQEFSDVIVLEQTYEDGALSRSYFVKGFGEIKREYSSEENGETFTVTSVIERIE